MSEQASRPRMVTAGHYAETFDARSEDEVYDPEKEGLIRNLLSSLGEDPNREGLRRTPLRVAKAMDFLTSGYHATVDEVIKGAVFTEDCREMVVVRGIEFYSLCEHHMLPFFGHAHVAYLPKGKVVGLSKIARVVDVFARRLQVQERMTQQIAETLYECLNPDGVAVVAEARHLCMMMRGVEKQNSVATTSAMMGVFRDDEKTRGEFLNLTQSRLS